MLGLLTRNCLLLLGVTLEDKIVNYSFFFQSYVNDFMDYLIKYENLVVIEWWNGVVGFRDLIFGFCFLFVKDFWVLFNVQL